MKKFVLAAVLFALNPVLIDRALSDTADSWKAIGFLEGTWNANTQGGSAGAQGSSTYTFKPELKHHVLVRSGDDPSSCKGPAAFDCEHSDILYVYQQAKGQPLQAIYFDNEGHVIRYVVSTPDPSTVVFLSEASQTGLRYRLVYELKDAVMSGKFQMLMPGQQDWMSYLEWSGAKK